MIQMANKDRQSACLIFDNAFYLYRTRLLSLYSEHKCNYKKHWRNLYTERSYDYRMEPSLEERI